MSAADSTEYQLLNVSDGANFIRDVRVKGSLRYFRFVNLYECTIGRDCSIGAFVEIQKNATIGDRCKISSHSFICEGVHIGDDVFVGHGVMFINDKFPRSSVDGRLIREEWTLTETFIEDQVSIGSNATILCGIRLGKGALIGAGAVVTRDVAPGERVAGAPARPLAGG